MSGTTTERVVVTGGAGVIGVSLVEQLVEAGHAVRVVDLLARPAALPAAVDYVQGDIVDLGAEVISSFDPTIVYHLAAAFERSDEHPQFWQENAHHNVAVSAIVLAGATSSPSLRRYVFASSYLIYDPKLYLFDEPQPVASELVETAAVDPRNATGAAKLLHEKEIELASGDPDHPFTWVAARIYRVYGPSSRDVISRWIRAAVAGEPIDVYGDESRFDYVFAADVAEGLRRLGDSDASGIVNLARGSSHTVREVVEALRAHVPDLEVNGPDPAPRYEASQASVARLRELTGWSPSTGLERGISTLVAHERALADAGTVNLRVREPMRMNVLITSVSQKVPLVRAVRAAYRALNLVGDVWGADVDETIVARAFLDRFWQMPRLSELDDDEIVKFCAANEIGLLIPTRDGELARFAELRESLGGDGTFVPIGDPSSVAACDDKLEFARRCTAADIASIPTSDVVTPDLGDRLVVKDRYGAGGRGAVIDVGPEDAAEAARALDAAVVQPYVEGHEYSIDTYVTRDGTSLGAVARRRVRIHSGESAITTVVDEPSLRQLAAGVTTALGVRGHAVVQAIRSPDGDLVLECNSRVGGASNAAWASGLRTIDAMMLEALGESPMPIEHLQSPLTMVRAGRDRFDWP